MIQELVLTAVLAALAAAQVGPAFEAKMVKLKIDMPATQQGVDLYPDRDQPLELGSYQHRLKQFGIAVRMGDTIMVTKVKVKDKAIEFHLGGGGYGTFWDEKATSSASTGYKSARERSLEDRIRNEKDPSRRRSLESDLRSARRERERRDDRERAQAAVVLEAKQQRIAAKRLDGGSRFNIKFEGAIPPEAVTTEMIRKALEAYVEFDSGR
jgi:hypothetical protein